MKKKNTFVTVVIVIVFALLAIGTWLMTKCYAEYNTTNNMSEEMSVESMTINSNNTNDDESVESSQINISVGDAFNNLWEVGN